MKASSERRARPNERPATPIATRETENVKRVVQLIYEYGLLSQDQLGRLLNLTRPTVQHLLQRMYYAYYIDREFLPLTSFGSSPALYILDKFGKVLLRRMGVEEQSGILNKGLSPLFLQHTLSLSEVHLSIERASRGLGYNLEQWITDNRLKSDYDRVKIGSSKHPVSLIPDGYFKLFVPEIGTSHCFIELDRATSQLSDFAKKVEAYVAYYKSGLYSKRYSAQGFRVLTIVDADVSTRVESLRNVTRQVGGIGRRFWFAHIRDVTTEKVFTEPIWRIAGGEDEIAFLSPKRD